MYKEGRDGVSKVWHAPCSTLALPFKKSTLEDTAFDTPISVANGIFFAYGPSKESGNSRFKSCKAGKKCQFLLICHSAILTLLQNNE
jgi:hypothetical protein